MNLTRKRRISVIVEMTFRDEVLRVLEAAGASGYTVYTEICGKGRHGVRGDFGSLTVSSNVEVVCIASDQVAERAFVKLEEMIQKGVVMIVHVIDVEVMRDEHFS